MSSPVARPTPRSKIGVRYQDAQRAALEPFAERGFSRVGMRDLAAHMGIAAGSLYNHIESKEALLFEFIEELYEELLLSAHQASRQAVTASARLQALIEAHLRLHAKMGAHFRLAEYESHCLASEQQTRIRELRARYEQLLIESVERCSGKSVGASGRAALSGIVTLLNQLPAWVEAPQLSPQARQDLLCDMALGTLRGVLLTPRD